MKNIAAKKRQASGAAAEELLEWAHLLGRNQGSVTAWKAPTPLKILKEMGANQVLCAKERKSGADYYGVLKGGRAFLAECKSCQSANFSLRNIEDHQIAFLDEWEAMGASCWLVIVWTPDSIQAKEALRKITAMPTVLCPIPWKTVSELCAANKPSIPWTVLLEHAKPSMAFYVDPPC